MTKKQQTVMSTQYQSVKQQTEADIQSNIRLALSKHGTVFRMQSGIFYTEQGQKIRIGVPGMSDLLFIGHNFIAWIEVKNSKGRPSKEQLNFISLMQSMGHKAGIARSVEDALYIIGVKNPTL